jgi:hypothetical protein
LRFEGKELQPVQIEYFLQVWVDEKVPGREEPEERLATFVKLLYFSHT